MRKRRTTRKLLTRLELAAVLDCHVRSISRLQADGLPVARRGRGGRKTLFDERVAVAWMLSREATHVGVEALRRCTAEKLHAEAILLDQTFKIRARDLLPRDEVEKVWSLEISAVRALLEAWVSPLAAHLCHAAAEGIPEIEHALDDEVRGMLTRLADPARITHQGGV
jgi:hypothetical protein